MGRTPEDRVSQAVGGNQDALERLLAEHGPAVYRHVAGKIPQRFQAVLSAADVMQQTYTDAFLHFDEFAAQSVGAFHAWLVTIAERNLISALRMLETEKRGGGRRQIELRTPDDSLVALYDLVGATDSTPSRRASRKEASAAVKRALAALPPDYAQVVQRYDLEGQPVEQVAEALGRSPGAVYMVRARAHRRLAELLGNASAYMSTG